MIDSLYVPLRDALKAKGVPFEVAYGPTQVPPAVGASRVQLMSDPGGDAMIAPRGRFVNPRVYVARLSAGVVRIFAKETRDGAMRREHEALANRIADHVHTELHKLASRLKSILHVTRLGFVSDDTTDGWAGCVYEIRFQVERSAADTTWTGAAADTASPAIVTTLDASGPVAAELPSATTRIQ